MNGSHAATHHRDSNTCCFWLQHSETCENVKIGSASIVAALVAIAVSASVLWILVNQGVDLGAINSIAQTVPSHWAYIGMGVTVATGVIDTIFIIAMVRAYRNKTYSEKELQKLGITEQIAQEHISDKLIPKSYWMITQKGIKATKDQPGSPSVYAIVVSNPQGRISVRGFKLESDLNSFINNKLNGYLDGKDAFENGNEYTEKYIQSVLGVDNFNALILPYKKTVEPSTCRTFVFEHFGVNCAILMANVDGHIHIHYCRNDAHLHQLCTVTYNGLTDSTDAYSQANQRISYNPIPLNVDERELFTLHFDDKQFYMLAFTTSNEEPQLRCFMTEAAREMFIQTNLMPLYNKDITNTPYNPENVSRYAKLTDLDLFNKLMVSDLEYFTGEIETQHHSHSCIYGLVLQENEQRLQLYFRSADQRQEYISQLNPAFLDRRKLENQIYGEDGIIEKHNLKNLCTVDNQCWPAEVCIDNQTKYLIIYFYNHAFNFFYWNTKQECDAALAPGGSHSPENGYVNVAAPKAPPPSPQPETYTYTHVESLISPTHLNHVIQTALAFENRKKKELATFNIPIQNSNPQQIIFALVYNDQTLSGQNNGKTVYFSSEAARNQFISTKLAGYTNTGALQQAAYGVPEGMPGNAGVLCPKNLEMLLSKPGDTYTFETTVSGKQYFMWYFRDGKGNLAYRYNEDAAKRQIFIGKPYTDMTTQINAINHAQLKTVVQVLRDKLLITKIVTEKGQFWIEPDIALDGTLAHFLFYNSGKELKTHIFFSVAAAREFSTKLSPSIDAKLALEKSLEYPQALGQYLLDYTDKPMATIQRDFVSKVFIKEFMPLTVKWNDSHPPYANFPALFPLLVRENNNVCNIHYYKTSEARTQTHESLRKDSYANSLFRDNIFQAFLKAAVWSLWDDDAQPKKPVFLIIENAPSQLAQIIDCSFNGQKTDDPILESRYVHLSQVEKVRADKKNALELAIQNWQKLPITEKEKNNIASLFANSFDKWIQQGHLKENEFVCRRSATNHYNLLLIRHKDENGRPSIDPLYFKKGDKQSTDLVANLLSQNYTNRD